MSAAALDARAQSSDLKARVATVLRKQLDSLLDASGTVSHIKGKSGDGLMAAAFQLMYEVEGDVR